MVYASLPMEANQPEPQIVNLTPEPLVLRQLRAAGPALITVLPSGRVARAEERIEIVGDVRGVPIVRVAYAAIVDLPPPEAGAYYVVSRLVADVAYHAGRPIDDLLVAGDHMVDEDHHDLGCRALQAWEPMVSRRGYIAQLRAAAQERYRMERSTPDALREITPMQLEMAAASAEFLVIGLSDPGEFGQTLLSAVTDTITLGFQAVIGELVAARRRAQMDVARRARSRRETEQ